MGNTVLLFDRYADIAGHRFLLFDIGGAIAIAGMTYMAVAATVRHIAVLYYEDRMEDC